MQLVIINRHFCDDRDIPLAVVVQGIFDLPLVTLKLALNIHRPRTFCLITPIAQPSTNVM